MIGTAIVAITLVVVLIICVLAGMWHARQKNRAAGDLTYKQEQELRRLSDKAADVMRHLGPSMDIEDSDLLTPRSRGAVNDWLREYNQLKGKM